MEEEDATSGNQLNRQYVQYTLHASRVAITESAEAPRAPLVSLEVLTNYL